MRPKGFNLSGLCPQSIDRLAHWWQVHGRAVKWMATYAGLPIAGYLLHVILCATGVIKR